MAACTKLGQCTASAARKRRGDPPEQEQHQEADGAMYGILLSVSVSSFFLGCSVRQVLESSTGPVALADKIKRHIWVYEDVKPRYRPRDPSARRARQQKADSAEDEFRCGRLDR